MRKRGFLFSSVAKWLVIHSCIKSVGIRSKLDIMKNIIHGIATEWLVPVFHQLKFWNVCYRKHQTGFGQKLIATYPTWGGSFLWNESFLLIWRYKIQGSVYILQSSFFWLVFSATHICADWLRMIGARQSSELNYWLLLIAAYTTGEELITLRAEQAGVIVKRGLMSTQGRTVQRSFYT